MSKIAVTGGRGFIGGHVVQALRMAKHEVFVLDQNDRADYVVDVRDGGQVWTDLTACGAEYVFHLAAIADARSALEDPVEAVQVNIGGTAAVADAARYAHVKRLILASTCWVANAMAPGVLDESSPFQPEGGGHVYTTAKIASEMLVHDFQSLYGLDFTILRYGIPYGPRMWKGLVLQNWVKLAVEGKPIQIYGDGSNSRRFVHVSDLAQAHVLALQEVARNQTYNLEGMRSVTIKELAETFQQLWCEWGYNPSVQIEYVEEPSRVGEMGYLRKVINSDKALMELGWEPKIDLHQGLRNLIASLNN